MGQKIVSSRETDIWGTSERVKELENMLTFNK
jgi:hypothetical protein